MRRALLLLTAVAGSAVVAASAASAKTSFPTVISLPNGWQPEGIAIQGNTFYAGSRTNGAVWRGDLRTGEGGVLVQGVGGRVATGLKVDRGLLFVSGASTGRAWVFDAGTGAQLREYQFADPPGHVRQRRRGDEGRRLLHRLEQGGALQGAALAERDAVDHLPDAPAHGRLPARPRLQPERDRCHAEREDADRGADSDGEALHDRSGHRPGPRDLAGRRHRHERRRDLLDGKTLYVVRNSNNLIAVVRLSSDQSSGTVVDTSPARTSTSPTTVARAGNRLYLVNARSHAADADHAVHGRGGAPLSRRPHAIRSARTADRVTRGRPPSLGPWR